MTSTSLVSIVVPCKEVDDYTKECINNCKMLNYPNIEIILLPDFIKEKIDGVKTIVTGPVSPGIKRNLGVKNSTGNLCAFIDNDAYPHKDWITNALELFDDPQVGAVGGPGLTPKDDSFMQQASGYVLSSFMVGELSSRYQTKRSFESEDIHSCNFIARKSVILAAGGWNEKYWPGEDTLMCLSIRKLGKKLVESSDVVVYHHRRALFRPHLKQVSRFGEHRGFFAKHFPENSAKLNYFFPSLLIASLVLGIAFSLFFPWILLVLLTGIAIYLGSSLIASRLQTKNAKLLIIVWMGIIATHLVYGSYFLSGLVKRDLKR